MFEFHEINRDYLDKLASFLYSVSWLFSSLNTQYVKEKILVKHREYLILLNSVDINELVSLTENQNNHPDELQQLIKDVNFFKINYSVIKTKDWKCRNQQRKLSVKKLYEIENLSLLINEVCKDEVKTLVDFGSGLGYLDEVLFSKYGYKIIGLEGNVRYQEQAIKRQEKYYPRSIGMVKHVQHFITLDSRDFIVNQVDMLQDSDVSSKIGLFGLHPCGDLSIVCIKLFLDIPRVTKLIFSPCCYHKMSAKDTDFNEFHHFPLSVCLKEILRKFPSNPFTRSFLRLAGQQSPYKFKEMSQDEHFIHGKNMFERAVVEGILEHDEMSKRINNINIKDGPLKFEDITLKYQILDKSTQQQREWTSHHHDKFNLLRSTYPDGEVLSENLFCLQTAVQNCCESLVVMDRIFYIYEQARVLNLRLKVSIKKLQNEKLTPRCLIFVVEKI